MPISSDPVSQLGLDGFAKALRQGRITSEQAVRAYLERIEHLEPQLGAFERIEWDRSLVVARAMDALLASGVDLGPLMGLPITVKDIFVLDGKPPHAGSNLPLEGRFSSEDATFVTALKQSGCVILGTTKMVEFALGITGHSVSRGTPWNPWDDRIHRLPGGSSSGSAVALSAGLCAMSIGTDTGGSVRAPAAMCGLFGLKTTARLWPNKGAFPLDPQTDTIGLLTRTARDAQLAFHTLNGHLNSIAARPTRATESLKLGLPMRYMLDDISHDISAGFEKVLRTLADHHAEIVSVDIPNVDGREKYFPSAMPTELISWLGEETFLDQKASIDPTIRARIEKGLMIKAHDFLSVSARRREHALQADKLFDEVDLIVSPTTQETAIPVSELENPEKAMQIAMGMTRNTQPANYFDWCAATLPIGTDTKGLPFGLQLNARGNTESSLLAMAVWIESIVGESLTPPPFKGHLMV